MGKQGGGCAGPFLKTCLLPCQTRMENKQAKTLQSLCSLSFCSFFFFFFSQSSHCWEQSLQSFPKMRAGTMSFPQPGFGPVAWRVLQQSEQGT